MAGDRPYLALEIIFKQVVPKGIIGCKQGSQSGPETDPKIPVLCSEDVIVFISLNFHSFFKKIFIF